MLQVLLVDDDVTMLDLLQSHIPWASCGFSIMGTAQNGEDALKLLRHSLPDLIITDVKMPVMDGMSFCKCVRQMRDDIPIILLSAYEDMETARLAIKYNVTEYLLKPLNEQNIQLLTQILQESAHNHELRYFFASICNNPKRRAEIAAHLGSNDAAWFQDFFSTFTNCFSIRFHAIQTACYRWENAPCVVQMWYSGEAAGRAIADILFGKVNPSGKLSETFPIKERKDICYPGDGVKCEYNEKLNVGYRYYDAHPDEVWFPFGHGVSYTEFEYSDLILSEKKLTTDTFSLEVSFQLKNIGEIAGKEAVQLYVAPLDSIVARPIKELRAFDKIELRPGEEKNVTFTLNNKDFAYYNSQVLRPGYIVAVIRSNC